MGDIPEERSAGIVGSGEIIPVMKEPAGPGVDRQILIGEHPPPA